MGLRDIHIPTAAASVIAAVLAGAGTTMVVAPQPTKVIEHQAVGKYGWGELTAAEQKQAAALIGDMDRREVQIFCVNAGCSDLAEDMDQVFDMTGAASNVQRPIIDLGAGMGISPDEPATRKIADAFRKATKGRIDLKVIDRPQPGGGVVIALGRKPRK